MKIDYEEVKDRLIDYYKKDELDYSKIKKGTATERLKTYAKIFLGEDIDISKVDSTNLYEFVRKVLKDLHPDSNNLSDEFRNIAAFITSSYTDIKKNIDVHPMYATHFEYVSKQELEKKDEHVNKTSKNDDSSTKKQEEPSNTEEIVSNRRVENEVETGIRNINQPFFDKSMSHENVRQNSGSKEEPKVDVLSDDYNSGKEIIVSYAEVKERLKQACKENNLSISNTSAKERYTKYCKIILGVDDILNVDSANFRDVCAQIVKDFSDETINSYKENIFVAEKEELQNIQFFLNNAYKELNDQFEILSNSPYRITYVGRSRDNEIEEALEYNKKQNGNNLELPDNLEKVGVLDTLNQKKERLGYPALENLDKKEEKISNPPALDDLKKRQNKQEEPQKDIPTIAALENPNKDEEAKKDVKAYLKAVGKLLPYALAGAGVGLATATILPTITFSGLGTIRIAYQTAKLANKIVSKGFLNGRPTPVDNIVMNAKEKLKEKYGDKKIYQAVEKMNKLLKNPKVQWFLNGAAVGYKLGEALNLHDKLSDLMHPEKTTVDTNVMTPSAANEVSSQETILDKTNQGQGHEINPEKIVDTDSLHIDEAIDKNNISYADLNTGDNIDLSSVERGFVNSSNAIHEVDSVHLLTQLASRENGTSIKLLKLPDGTNFTGNIGELLQSGIDPNQVAARIVNQNGDYAWLNLQDVLDVYNNSMGMSR